MATATPNTNPVPSKSRRVRTGCLTCRERHLKCDEGTPDCNNCRKSNRECKRGVRLNFIDTTCKKPPYLISPEVIAFEDESRLIASEYRGGLEKYPKLANPAASAHSKGIRVETTLRRQTHATDNSELQKGMEPKSATMIHTPHSLYFNDCSQAPPDLNREMPYPSRRTSNTSFTGATPGSVNSAGYGHLISDPFTPTRDDSSRLPSHHSAKSSEVPTPVSVARATRAGPPSTFRGDAGPGGQNPEMGPETGMMTPPNEKTGEREYLNSPEELRFMQVFVAEVGIWMDSLDREKHFSRMIPYHALRCPMLLNALLACGVKHLTLTQQYGDDKALFYYDTATTQLLRSLQNPERNTAECAATAVVLNVYEIMSEKPTQRMSHIAGARALIRECGWSARSVGLGAACFWLNVGMELLSCLAFNWQTAWDPDHWGVDMGFLTSSSHPPSSGKCANSNDDNSKKKAAAVGENGNDELSGSDTGNEEIWVHRIFYIVAKIANFRATIPKFQEASPHDEQIRLQARHAEWQHLKNMCDSWNEAVPRAMHPFGYVFPSQAESSKSLFPNVWLIKRAAIIGRLYYHAAQCLLAQINPVLPRGAAEMRTAQLHHAHQVCGIVAHTEDRGVASVSIRSLAIVAEVLADSRERREVVAILQRIDRDTGWKLAGVLTNLRRVWGWTEWEGLGLGQGSDRGQGQTPPAAGPGAPCLPRVGSSNSRISSVVGAGSRPKHIDPFLRSETAMSATARQTTTPPDRTQQPPPNHHQSSVIPVRQQSIALAAPRPMRVNPLSCADFNHPNHPYQNWYEPPSRPSSYNSQGFP